MPQQRFFKNLTQAEQYVSCGLAAAATGYSAWYSEGPYRWLAELQMRFLGWYEIRLTALFSFLLCYIAAAALLSLLQVMRTEERQRPSASPPDLNLKKLTASLLTDVGHLAFLGVIMIGIGACQYLSALRIGELKHVELASLESGGAAPRERWWEIEGTWLFAESQLWEDARTTKHYIPFVSDSWREGGPVSVVVLVRDLDFNTISEERGRITGLTNSDGLAGPIAERWQSKKAPLGANPILLEYKDSPARRVTLGEFVGALGAFVLAISLGWRWAQKKRA